MRKHCRTYIRGDDADGAALVVAVHAGSIGDAVARDGTVLRPLGDDEVGARRRRRGRGGGGQADGPPVVGHAAIAVPGERRAGVDGYVAGTRGPLIPSPGKRNIVVLEEKIEEQI